MDGPFYQPGKVRAGNRIFNVPLEVEDEAGKLETLSLKDSKTDSVGPI